MADGSFAITGIGLATALGDDARACFQALVDGKSAVAAVPRELARGTSLQVAALASGFDPAVAVGKRNVRRTARFLQLALLAGRTACQHAGLRDAAYAPARVGSIVGSALGGYDGGAEAARAFKRAGLRQISPFAITGSVSNMAAGAIAIEAGVNGPCYCPAAWWASSGYAIAQALQLLRAGVVDAMIVGGVEALSDGFVMDLVRSTGQFTGYADPADASCRPFDRRRNGMVAAEGAVILILESTQRAKARGAKLYAELLGYGVHHAPLVGDSDAQRARSMAAAIKLALNDAEVGPESVEYVDAYGSAARTSDRLETAALKGVFGARAGALWVSSYKGATGNLLAASSAFSLAMTAIALDEGVVPATRNLEQRDPDCDLDYVAGSARTGRRRVALSNTFSESGHNVAFVLRAIA